MGEHELKRLDLGHEASRQPQTTAGRGRTSEAAARDLMCDRCKRELARVSSGQLGCPPGHQLLSVH
jgi:hypothetical protein